MSFMSKEQIEKAIASIAQRGVKLDRDVQVAGLSILNHVNLHGDITLANKLFNSMSRGMRRNSLGIWLTMFGKLTINLDPATKKDMPLAYDKARKTDLEGAAKTMWFDVKKEPDLDVEFDVQGALEKVLAKAQKDGTKVKDPEMLAKLATLLHPVIG